MTTWDYIVTASAVLLLGLGVVYCTLGLSGRGWGASPKATAIIGVGSILIGASRFVPDVLELPFLLSMGGFGTMFYAWRLSQSESNAGAS